jgi:hypothetical protein
MRKVQPKMRMRIPRMVSAALRHDLPCTCLPRIANPDGLNEGRASETGRAKFQFERTAACVPSTTEASYTAKIDIPIRGPARTTPILDTLRPFGTAPHTSRFNSPSAPCKDQSASTDGEKRGGGGRTNIARSIPYAAHCHIPRRIPICPEISHPCPHNRWDSNPRVLDGASSSPRALAPEPYRSRVHRLRAPRCGQERLAPVGRPRICFVARW